MSAKNASLRIRKLGLGSPPSRPSLASPPSLDRDGPVLKLLCDGDAPTPTGKEHAPAALCCTSRPSPATSIIPSSPTVSPLFLFSHLLSTRETPTLAHTQPPHTSQCLPAAHARERTRRRSSLSCLRTATLRARRSKSCHLTRSICRAVCAFPGLHDDPGACLRAIDPRPSHLTCQWLCARCIRRTTITNLCLLCRYVSEGDDAGAASESDDDDAEEEVEEEEDAETAPRKSHHCANCAIKRDVGASADYRVNSSQSQEAQDRAA